MGLFLGIELGSTRIKSVAIDENFKPVSSGEFVWQSKYEKGIWTYDLEQVWKGIKTSLDAIENRECIKAVGISGMMHGFLAFDKDWNLLTPFRTWQNTITSNAAEELTEIFNFNIPQRWSIAHLYQAILNNEDYIGKIAHITTLAGYVHFMLTGVNVVGIGEASGMFPIDSDKLSYNKVMLDKFNNLIEKHHIDWKLENILPQILLAGEQAGNLTKEGAYLVDNSLDIGIPFAPPEGDAGTGMVATNSISPKTGNISAGTSIFSMIVLEKNLKKVYPEIDVVTTPTGKSVAMVHCNNCTNDSNAWISVLRETINLFGAYPDDGDVYKNLYTKSLDGDADCGGVLVCNYLSGEGVTHFDSGIPLIVRKVESNFTLANFIRANLYSTMSTLKIGMDILADENVKIDSLTGHGGLFKTKGVGQKYISAACNAPVTCMETAGEGGPYGMALLAAFLFEDNIDLDEFLQSKVFKNVSKEILYPDKEDVDGFNKYLDDYKKILEVERKAIEVL